MYIMEQKSILKSSIWKVFEIFVDEPAKIHFIKEISRKISLSPTSVKKHIEDLEKSQMIVRKKGERFFGYIADRDNEKFLFYMKIFNIIKIKESGLLTSLSSALYPKAIVLYGSFFRGEDTEESDIDFFILSEKNKHLNLEDFEKKLKRNIHLIIEPNLKKVNKNIRLEILNGLVLEGYIKDE